MLKQDTIYKITEAGLRFIESGLLNSDMKNLLNLIQDLSTYGEHTTYSQISEYLAIIEDNLQLSESMRSLHAKLNGLLSGGLDAGYLVTETVLKSKNKHKYKIVIMKSNL